MSNSYVSTKEQFLCKLTKKPKFNNVILVWKKRDDEGESLFHSFDIANHL